MPGRGRSSHARRAPMSRRRLQIGAPESEHTFRADRYYRDAAALAKGAEEEASQGNCRSAYHHLLSAQAHFSIAGANAQDSTPYARGERAIASHALSHLQNAKGAFAARCVRRRRGSR